MALVVATSLAIAVAPARADGTSWSAHAEPEVAASAPVQQGDYWSSVAYGNGVWVAVALFNGRVMRSTDGGVNWAAVAVEVGNWRSVAYGNGRWVAVAGSGTKRSMYSDDDGQSWTATTTPHNLFWQSVAYGETVGHGAWIAVASTSTVRASRLMRSTDGENWAELTGHPGAVNPSDSWSAVAFGDGVWVTVSNTPGFVMRSTDGGVNWAAVAVPEENEWRSVAYGNGVWVAVSQTGSNRVMRSTDGGVNWAAVAATEENEWRSVAYGNGVWVAVSQTGSNRVMRSTNGGVNWTAVAAIEQNVWQSVAYGNDVWVAVSWDGDNQVMRSPAITVGVQPDALAPAVLPPSVSCAPLPAVVRATITCTVTGGDAGIDILWRAAYNPVIAEAGVTLDASGSGEFSFTVPAAALGEELTVELVDWTAPVSIGVAGGPVPTSVPSGGGPVPVWTLGLLALAGGLALRRGSRSGRSAWRVG